MSNFTYVVQNFDGVVIFRCKDAKEEADLLSELEQQFTKVYTAKELEQKYGTLEEDDDLDCGSILRAGKHVVRMLMRCDQGTLVY